MRHLMLFSFLVCAGLFSTVAKADQVRGLADIESISIAPTPFRSDILFNARFVDSLAGRPAGATIRLRVPTATFGDVGVDRVQRLLTAALIGRNRMLIVYESSNAQLLSISLQK